MAFPDCLRGPIHCFHPRILRISQSIKEMNSSKKEKIPYKVVVSRVDDLAQVHRFSFVTSQRFQAVRISTHVLKSGASQRSRDGLFPFVGGSQRGYRPNYRWRTTAKGFFFSMSLGPFSTNQQAAVFHFFFFLPSFSRDFI